MSGSGNSFGMGLMWFAFTFIAGSKIGAMGNQDDRANQDAQSEYLCKSQFTEQAKNRPDVPSDSKQGNLFVTNNKLTCRWEFNSTKDGVKTATTLEYPVLPASAAAPVAAL